MTRSTFATRRRRCVGRLATAGAIVAVPLGLVLVTAPAALAVDPVCGSTLTASVTLTADLDCSADTTTPALIIGANSITINLNGFTLTGPGGSSGTDGIYADAPESYGYVTVDNGTVSGFANDVYIDGAHNLTVKALTLDVDGTNAYDGLYLDNVAKATVSGINVTNADFGVQILGSSQIAVSSSSAQGDNGGFYGTTNTAITYSHDNASNGASIGGNGFVDNGSTGDVFFADTADVDANGFNIDGDGGGRATITGNTANSNTGYGFELEGNSDYDFGIVGQGEILTGNTADSNGTGGIADEFEIGATVHGNTANDNTGDGLLLDELPSSLVTANTASYNTEAGIYLPGNGFPYNVKSASKNHAYYNLGYGLNADSAAPGYSNVALHNTPFDCYNFVCGKASSGPRR